ncbi:MAG: hypothetical protein ACHQ51_04495 [Elusimicrobiota bacterium]
MIDITPRRRELILFAGLMMFAGAAAAQNVATDPQKAGVPSLESAVRGSYLLHACRTGRGLSLCLGGDEDAPSAFAARFDKLTRLAGMFMGRVQAMTVCGMRVQLKLDLL